MVSRIVNNRKKKAKFEALDISAIYSTIVEHFEKKNAELIEKGHKPRLSAQEKKIQDMMNFVKYVIHPQLDHSFVLYLGDKEISEEINVSERHAKTLRLELKAAGVIWFPEYSRPKKKGDLPMWMVAQEFLTYEKFEDEGFKVKKKAKNQKYVPQYYKFFADACAYAYEELEEMDLVVDKVSYFCRVYQILDDILRGHNLTKEDLLK